MKMGLRWPQRSQQNGVTLRPPIKGRIPPINGSTPVAVYQWNLLNHLGPTFGSTIKIQKIAPGRELLRPDDISLDEVEKIAI